MQEMALQKPQLQKRTKITTLQVKYTLKFHQSCILGNHFIGVLYGILHFLILLVYPEKLMENLLLLNTFCTPLYLLLMLCLKLHHC